MSVAKGVERVSHGQRRDRARGIAQERMLRLAELAAAEPDPDRARRFVSIARRISTRHRVPLPRRLRRFACRECDAYLVPGRNCRVRLEKRRVVVTCLKCGKVKRYPYP